MGYYSDYVNKNWTKYDIDDEERKKKLAANENASVNQVLIQSSANPEKKAQELAFFDTLSDNDKIDYNRAKREYHDNDTLVSLAFQRNQKQRELDELSKKENYTTLWDALTTKATIDDWKADRTKKNQLSSEIDKLSEAEEYLKQQEKQEELQSLSTRQIESRLNDAENQLKELENEKENIRIQSNELNRSGGTLTNTPNYRDARIRDAQNVSARDDIDSMKAENEAKRAALEAEANTYRAELQRRSDNAILDSIDEETKKELEELNMARGSRSASTLWRNNDEAYGGNDIAEQWSAEQAAEEKLRKKGYTKEAIEQMAEVVRRETNKEETKEIRETAKQFGEEHPVLSTIASPAMSIAETAGTLSELNYSAMYGTDYDTQSSLNFGYNAKNAMQEGVIENFDDGLLSKNTKAFLYQTGTSMLDSMTAAPFGGAGAAMLGMNAFSETLNQNIESGKDFESALAGAVLAGAAETVFEKISIGELSIFKETGEMTVKGVVKDILKTTTVNYSEEATTEIANIISDYLVNGGMSDFSQNMAKYVEQGMSPEEAKKKAIADAVKQVNDAGIGGAIMGGAFGVGGTAFRAANTTAGRISSGSQIASAEGGVQNVLTGATNVEGKQASKLSDAVEKAKQRVVAEEAAKQTANQAADNEKTLPGSSEETQKDKKGGYTLAERYKIGKLAEMVDRQFSKDVEAAQKEVIGDRLKELGESTSGKTDNEAYIKKLAGAIYDSFSGNEAGVLKEASRDNIISNSKYGQRVLNELRDTEGRFTSGWKSNFIERFAEINDRYTSGKKVEINPQIEKAIENIEKHSSESESMAGFNFTNYEKSVAQQLFEKTKAKNGVDDAEAFARDFETLYTYGMNGLNLNEAKLTEASGIDNDIAKSIFALGADRSGKIRTLTQEGITLKEEIRQSDAKLSEIANSAVRTGISSKEAPAIMSAVRRVAQYAAISEDGLQEAQKDGLFRSISGDLDEETIEKAFQRGKELVVPANITPARRFVGKANFTDNVSYTFYEGLSEAGKGQLKAIRQILKAYSEKLGINTRIENNVQSGEKEGNAFFDRKTNTLVVGADASNLFTAVIHESTHALALSNPKAYLALAGAAREFYIQKEGKDGFTLAMLELADAYGMLDKNAILEEFTANFMEGAFNTEEGARDFIDWLTNESGYTETQKKGVLRTIIDALTDFINSIKEIIRSGSLSSRAARTAQEKLEKEADTAEKIRRMYIDALDQMSGEGSEKTRSVERPSSVSGEAAATFPQRGEGKSESAEQSVYHVEVDEDDLPFSLKEEPFKLRGNNALAQLVKNLHGSKKYNAIRDYILETLSGEDIVFSDGRKAIVDNSDANHIASGAYERKTAAISEIKELIKRAQLIKDDFEAKHPKFTHFAYYETIAEYDGKVYRFVINVGKGRTDNKYHVYDINNPAIRNTALGDSMLESRGGTPFVDGVTNNYIPDSKENVKFSLKESSKVAAEATDEEYLKAARSGNTKTAQRMVEEAAKKAGYSDKLLHGTHKFGFTVFNRSFSDDNLSFFFTDNEDIAQSYSSVRGIRPISEKGMTAEGLSGKQLADALNAEVSIRGDALKSSFLHFTDKEISDFVRSNTEDLQKAAGVIEKLINEYSERMATDFDEADVKVHRQLVKLLDELESRKYQNATTTLFLLNAHTDAFTDAFSDVVAESDIDFSELDKNLRLRNTLENHYLWKMTEPELIVRNELDGYVFVPLTVKEAAKELNDMYKKGNFKLYGKPGRQLIIDGKGKNWNRIDDWYEQAVNLPKLKDTFVYDDGDYVYLLNKKTEAVIDRIRKRDHVLLEGINPEKMHDHVYTLIKQRYRLNAEKIYGMRTRDIAQWASKAGYDSVRIDNLNDNGGRGIDDPGAGTVFMYFKPENIKSADPITYDDEGNIIPLSERFNDEKEEIRWSLKDDGNDLKSLNDKLRQNRIDLRDINEKISKLKDGDEYKTLLDRVVANEDGALEDYVSWLQSSGLNEAVKRQSELETEIKELTERSERLANDIAAKAESEAIKASGKSEEEYFRSQAVKEFGYTPYFYDAGYLLPNGKLLNFSGEKNRHFGTRGNDHRAIGIVFETASGSDAMIRFMNMGNIRVMAEGPGIDLFNGIEPTNQQYSKIREMILEYAKKGSFSVDFSDEKGYSSGSLNYDGRINADRIINDIKHFYATGELREQSDVSRFHSDDGIKWSLQLANDESDFDKAKRLSEAKVEYVTASEESIKAASSVDVSDVKAQEASKILYPILSRLGILGNQFNDVLEIEFDYSKTGLDRSISHQINISGKNYTAQSLVLLNLRELCRTAYPVEAHADEKPKRAAPELKQIITLWNALQSGEDATFVKMTVKIPENQTNRLHMVISTETKKGLDLSLIAGGDVLQPAGKPNPTISIPQILEYVKDLDEFTKRIPVDMIESVAAEATEPSSVSGKAAATFPQSGEDKSEAELLDKAREALSLKTVPELLEENKALIRRNKQLENRLRKSEYTIKNAKFTFQVDLKKVDSVARVFIKQYDSKADVKSVADKLAEAYNLIVNGKNAAKADSLLSEAADEIIGAIKEEAVIDDFSQQILDEIRGASIKLSDEQKIETAYHYGSYGAFRKSLFGRTNISESGTPLDIQWAEWSEAYPSIFDATIPDVDQPAALKDIVDTLKEGHVEGFDEESMKEFFVEELREGVTQVPKAGTITSKEQLLLKEMHGDLRQTLKEVRSEFKKEYDAKLREAKKRIGVTYMGTERERQRLEETRARLIMRQEMREETATRAAYRNQLVKEIKRLDRMLRSPSLQTGVVPEHLRNAVAELLSAFTDDTSVFTYKQLDSISRAYDSIKATSAVDLSEDVKGWIEEIKDTVDGKRLSQLNEKQLAKVHNIFSYFIKLVQSENEIFKDGKWQLIKDLGENVINHSESQKNRWQYKFQPFFVTNNMTPRYLFKMLGGEIEKLFLDVRKGQEKYAKNIVPANEYFSEQWEKFNVDKWTKDKKTFTTERGTELTFTTQQLLTIYATFKREISNPKDSTHLMAGGIVFENQVDKNGKPKNDESSHPLTVKDLTELCGLLTDEQKKFADAMVKYLSEDMSELGNEVSMELLGFRKFTESYYFPFNSASNWLYKPLGKEAEKAEQRLKNMSFTKETVWGAKNPLIVADFEKIWRNHVERMISYNAYVIPMENFNKVWNYARPVIDEDSNVDLSENEKNVTVKSVISETFGKDSVKYVEDLFTDLNAGAKPDPKGTFIAKLTSLFKRNAVMLNLSVAIQQPSAILRAMAYVNPKYFVASTFHKPMASFEEAKKYASAALMKDIGGYNVGMGASVEDWIGERRHKSDDKGQKVKSAIDKAGGFLPERADAITWGHIWEAVKRETAAKTGLSGEELLRAAGERFDEVADLTQVYDSTFVRSGNMRSKDSGMVMITSFMAEPTLTLNMLMDAGRQAKAGNKQFAAAAFAAAISQIVFNSMLRSLISALRHKDDDETYLESYIGEFISSLFEEGNPLGMLPFVKDILSILQGYDVSRADMSVFSTVVNDFRKLWKEAQDLENSENKTKDGLSMAVDAIGSVSQFFGIPVKNVTRDVRAIMNTIESRGMNHTTARTASKAAKDATFPTIRSALETAGVIKQPSNTDKLYEAWLSGDSETFNRIARTYNDAKKIRTALTSQIKEDYLDGNLSYDDAYKLLDELKVDKIDEKINDWGETEPGTEEEGATITFDNFAEMLESSGTVSKGDTLYDAWKAGDSATYNEVAGTYSSGTGVKTVLSNHIKEEYLNNEISYSEAYSLLSKLGYEKIDEKIKGWTEPKEEKADSNASFLHMD